MILYCAGGFDFLSSVKKEQELAELCIDSFGSYNRLSSFFFKKETDNVIQVALNLRGVASEKDQNGEITQGD